MGTLLFNIEFRLSALVNIFPDSLRLTVIVRRVNMRKKRITLQPGFCAI